MRKLLRRASFTSQADLKTKILDFIEYFSGTMAKPFKWTYTGKPLTSPHEYSLYLCRRAIVIACQALCCPRGCPIYSFTPVGRVSVVIAIETVAQRLNDRI